MPGGYVDRWIDVWQRSAITGMFSDSQRRALADKLENELRQLEDYYKTVREYLSLDVKLKANPGNATLQTKLDEVWEICTSRNMLLPYRSSGISAEKTLALVAVAMDKELQDNLSNPVFCKELAIHMKEVKSISDQLGKDLQNYVTKTASTLLALKAVGGLDNMPDLLSNPPRPDLRT